MAYVARKSPTQMVGLYLLALFASVCDQRLCSQLAGVSLAASQRWAPPK